jgi:hypothetical protein
VAEKDPDVLDRDFIERYTRGVDEYHALVGAHAVGGSRGWQRRA